MEAIAIVSALALLQYTWFGFQVGQMRAKHGVKAPAVHGDPEFERMFRIHENTLEQLVVFLPALWMYGYYSNPLWGAGIGLVFIAGRFLYRAGYLKDPAKRGQGFLVSFLATIVLLAGSLIAAGRDLYTQL
ncbi:MAG: MAPEG family protein [Woeseiaceae bacterium]|nr:MAPEG family protein [Woeseiaceae bacterium]